MYSPPTFSVAGGSLGVPQPSLGVATPPPSVLVSLLLDVTPPAPAVVAVAVVALPVVALELELLLTLLAEDTLLDALAVVLVEEATAVALVLAVCVVAAVLLVVVGPDEAVTVTVAPGPVSLVEDAESESLQAGSATKSALATNLPVRGRRRLVQAVAG